MRVLGIIPSRYSSTRFPGKPLVDIGGKPMIQRVYEQCLQCKGLTKLIVATDDIRIEECIQLINGNVIMTSPTHQNGTERCAEVINKLNETYDLIINIQGDEPFINPIQIESLIKCFESNPTLEIATLKKKIASDELLFNTGVIKLVTDLKQMAMYFSRSPIPFNRNEQQDKWLNSTCYYKHIGIYGFLPEVLKKIVTLPESTLESVERLEQLRWLENGYKIYVEETIYEAKSIDTPEDLEYVLNNSGLYF